MWIMDAEHRELINADHVTKVSLENARDDSDGAYQWAIEATVVGEDRPFTLWEGNWYSHADQAVRDREDKDAVRAFAEIAAQLNDQDDLVIVS